MAIRLSGLASGMDTEAIVKQLMEAQTMKKTKVENKKTKLEWTKEKWKDLNTKLYSMYTDKVSKMRLTGTYNTKKSSVSDSSIASVAAGNNAANGNYTLEVNNIATSNYVTSGRLRLESGASDAKVTSTTKISELAGGADMVGQEIEISYDGKIRKLTIDEDTTVGDYVRAFSSVGLSASYDENQQRIFTSSSKSGAQSNFSLSITSDEGIAARDNLRDMVVADYSVLTQEEKDTIEAYMLDAKNNEVGSEKYNKAVTALQNIASASGNASNEQVQNAIDAYRNAPSGSSLTAVGMTNITAGKADSNAPTDMAVIEGTDSEIILNEAVLTGSGSTVKANGLTIDLKGVTNGSKITFSVANDTDAVYDMIKDFISEYNSVLGEMNKSYKAASARGYDPLTDEQRESMSDDQIEKWETKIKDSLLRRDSTLDGIINSMKNAMMSTVEVDGKKYSLSSLGIMTSKDYTENGLLHIYGDEDDTTYADKADKLKAMIDSDPELVTKIMTGIAGKLYEEMNNKMSSNKSMSSALTFYNDKQIDKQLKSYESEISDWDSYLQKLEDRYYKQFTAMEKAMTKMNQSQSYLSQMMGGGS